MRQRGLFGLSEHLEALSRDGDPLEVLDATVDFEHFRRWLVEGLGYGDDRKGGRPPFDPVSMFKVLILQAQHNLSDARMEFMIRDRLSWMRFLGFDLGAPTPDENTIRTAGLLGGAAWDSRARPITTLTGLIREPSLPVLNDLLRAQLRSGPPPCNQRLWPHVTGAAQRVPGQQRRSTG